MQLQTLKKIYKAGALVTAAVAIPGLIKDWKERHDPPDDISDIEAVGFILVLWSGFSLVWPYGLPTVIMDYVEEHKEKAAKS